MKSIFLYRFVLVKNSQFLFSWVFLSSVDVDFYHRLTFSASMEIFMTFSKDFLVFFPLRFLMLYDINRHPNIECYLHSWNTSHLVVVVVIVHSLSHVQLFATPRQAPLSFTISQSLLKLMSIESVMPSNHLILCRPLLLPSVFPSIRVGLCLLIF